MANRFTPGNVFWRGDWEYCPEYNIGDLVLRGGLFFLAIEHSAGEDPLDPLSVGYWLELGGGSGPVAELLWTGTTVNVTFARVATRTDLPITLIPGRLYYIADEGVVLLDMENGAEEYGGNHGMQYYRGAFATEADLIYAHPTDIEGAYAVVFATNTFWIWKDGRWLDTGTTATDIGVPPGGDLGDVLTKKSNADGDIEWKKVLPGHVIQDESGTALPQEPTIRFKGAAVTITDDPANKSTVVEIQSGGGGGHTILNDAGTAMPQRSGLRFLRCDVLDDGINNETVIDPNADHPYTPVALSPINGASDVPVYIRLKISPYGHPRNTPIGGSRWQVSTDSSFQTVLFDFVQNSSAPSIVITEDNGHPVLPVSTLLYWRAYYFDLYGTASEWSATVSYTTASVVQANSILAPDILAPVNDGYTPEAGMMVQLTSPEVIGTAVVDSSDIQVSMSNRFSAADIVASYDDNPGPLLVNDPLLNLSSVPSPVYIRGRQKDSNAGLMSAWSPITTAYIQRNYSDPCIGICIVADTDNPNNNFAYTIDKNWNRINVPVQYFENHPLFASIRPEKYTPPGDTEAHDVVRVNPFYVKVNTTSDGIRNYHKFLINPAPFSDGSGYLHPAFRKSLSGLRISGALLSQSGGYWRSLYDVAATSMSPDTVNAVITALNTGAPVQQVYQWTVHDRSALRLLMSIEKVGITTNIVSGNTGVANSSSNCNYRGIRCVAQFNTSTTTSAANTELAMGLRMTYFANYADGGKRADIQMADPTGTAIPVVAGLFNSGAVGTSGNGAVFSIHTGFNEFLGADMEIYGLPATVKVAAESPYVAMFNVNSGAKNVFGVTSNASYWWSGVLPISIPGVQYSGFTRYVVVD